jgi:hypothetical protein
LLQKVTTGLKRRNSLGQSDASGNESTVPRKKKKLDPASVSASSLTAKLQARRNDLSEASGTESSRRKGSDAKQKKKKPATGGTGAKGSLSSRANVLGGAGSGSESESVRRGLPIGIRSGVASPATGSRAASPAVGGKSGSRSGSPAGRASPAVGTPGTFSFLELRGLFTNKQLGAGNFPTEEEVMAAIPPDGVDLPILTKGFKSRIPASKEGQAQFIALVRRVSHFDKETKRLYRKK